MGIKTFQVFPKFQQKLLQTTYLNVLEVRSYVVHWDKEELGEVILNRLLEAMTSAGQCGTHIWPGHHLCQSLSTFCSQHITRILRINIKFRTLWETQWPWLILSSISHNNPLNSIEVLGWAVLLKQFKERKTNKSGWRVGNTEKSSSLPQTDSDQGKITQCGTPVKQSPSHND